MNAIDAIEDFNPEENTGLLKEFSRLKKGFQTLQEISLEIAETDDLDGSLQRIVDLIVDFMQINRSSIMLLEPDMCLRIKAFHGILRDIAISSCVRLGEGISGRTASEGRMIASQDISRDPQWKGGRHGRYQTNSFICIPMKIKEKVIGVINVNDKIDQTPFDLLDQELITIVASQVAVVIENFRLYSDLKKSVERLHRSNRRLTISKKRMKTIIEFIIDGVIVTDSSGRILLYNRNASSFFPILRVNSSVFKRLGNPEFGEWLRLRYKSVKEGGDAVGEYRLDLSKNRTIHFRIHSIPFYSSVSDKDYLLNIFSDVTFQLSMETKKREFIALVSHELRTPLTAIKAYLGPMIGGFLGDLNEDLKDGLMTINEAAQRLQYAVDNLILMSELDQDNETPEKEAFDLNDEIDKLVIGLKNEALEHGVTIVQRMCVDRRVIGSPKLIRVAIRNLLNNALKFSPSGSEVIVQTEWRGQISGEKIEVSVIDSGPGIFPQDRERIFERFEQVESHLIRQHGGIGIGLSMTKRIIELHGSVIELSSLPGRGSCFSFVLEKAIEESS